MYIHELFCVFLSILYVGIMMFGHFICLNTRLRLVIFSQHFLGYYYKYTRVGVN